MAEPPALEGARNFATELTETVQAVFEGSPEFQVRVAPDGRRVQLAPFDDGGSVARFPLHIAGNHVAHWKLSMLLDLDWKGKYLKVIKSNFSLTADVDKAPLVRYEFDDAMRTVPVAHWQFHGERGAFSHLLGLAQAAGREAKPYSLSSLHFPVGGPRMRPGVDDILEFLVREGRFDALPGWESALKASRARYRTIQARTIARDLQVEVADVLREEGWDVTAPEAISERGRRLLEDW